MRMPWCIHPLNTTYHNQKGGIKVGSDSQDATRARYVEIPNRWRHSFSDRAVDRDANYRNSGPSQIRVPVLRRAP